MIDFEAMYPEKGRHVPEEVAIGDAYTPDALYDAMSLEDGADAGFCYPL